MSVHLRMLMLAGLAATAACSDAVSPEHPPIRPVTGDIVQVYECQVTVATQSVACAEPGAGPSNARRLIIGGANGVFVLLTSSNRVSTPDSFAFDVTLQNRIVQTMGTLDGVTEHVDGIQIFFTSDPTATPADPNLPSSVSIGNPDGYGFFFQPMQPYFQYAGLLAGLQTSAARRWRFDLENVASFRFSVMVSTKVQYPQGWLDVAPGAPTIAVADVDTLTATMRDAYGRVVPWDPAAWTSSAPGVVTVTALSDSTAEITGVSAGTAWVKAASTLSSVRRDSVLVTVN